MRVEIGEEGLSILGMSRDQAGLLVDALRASPKQDFMDDDELRRLFRLMAVVKSDPWEDVKGGR
jgi:hypothetical protein